MLLGARGPELGGAYGGAEARPRAQPAVFLGSGFEPSHSDSLVFIS